MADGGLGKSAVVEDQQDMGDGIQCSYHPLKKNTGGICAFCLQDKLGKLVASPSFATLPPSLDRSSSSSTSPPFRSDAAGVYGGAFNQLSVVSSSSSIAIANTSAPPDFAALKRSKSTTIGTRGSSVAGAHQLLDKNRRRRRISGFWPFLYLSYSSSKQAACRRNVDKGLGGSKIISLTTNPQSSCTVGVDNARNEGGTETERRKVSRSRSVGCGSRSFSGDFFGRISNGFGDCTLRRVESQREAKANKSLSAAEGRQSSNHHQYMKEKVRCGGIFGGFKVTSSSSSSSSSSHSHWVMPNETAPASNKTSAVGGRPAASAAILAVNGRSHHQRNSWGWALASPMRVFSKPSSKNGKRLEASSSTKIDVTVPNLDAIPSLLTVSS